MNIIFNQEDWKKELGTKEEFEVSKEVCNLCKGLKKVGGFDQLTSEIEVTVPCPECCKEFYEMTLKNLKYYNDLS
jgi:hypothetical protein